MNLVQPKAVIESVGMKAQEPCADRHSIPAEFLQQLKQMR
jgi:hypothetical protein